MRGTPRRGRAARGGIRGQCTGGEARRGVAIGVVYPKGRGSARRPTLCRGSLWRTRNEGRVGDDAALGHSAVVGCVPVMRRMPLLDRGPNRGGRVRRRRGGCGAAAVSVTSPAGRGARPVHLPDTPAHSITRHAGTLHGAVLRGTPTIFPGSHYDRDDRLAGTLCPAVVSSPDDPGLSAPHLTLTTFSRRASRACIILGYWRRTRPQATVRPGSGDDRCRMASGPRPRSSHPGDPAAHSPGARRRCR